MPDERVLRKRGQDPEAAEFAAIVGLCGELGASDRHGALKILDSYMDGMLPGVRKVLLCCHHLEHGLAIVRVEGEEVYAGRRPLKIEWMRGIVRKSGFRNPVMEAELAKMQPQLGAIWKPWGHHDDDGNARTPTARDGGVSLKRVYLPPSDYVLPSNARTDLKVERIGNWTHIVRHAAESVDTGLFKLIDSGDCAVNVNSMAPRAYYPAHTDDWPKSKAQLPDIDGSGMHIITYSSTRALILVTPEPKIHGVGTLAFLVDQHDLWGMRSPPEPVRCARYNALHAVLNISNEHRLSVNFRIGGLATLFELVFSLVSCSLSFHRSPRDERPAYENSNIDSGTRYAHRTYSKRFKKI